MKSFIPASIPCIRGYYLNMVLKPAFACICMYDEQLTAWSLIAVDVSSHIHTQSFSALSPWKRIPVECGFLVSNSIKTLCEWWQVPRVQFNLKGQ